ncbi:MAG: AIR synthase-related protein, partial [Dehalococcoidia bacterium]
AASEAMIQVGVNACTDVTGFGLLGHLRSMVEGSKVGARLSLAQVPVIPGAWELAKQGIAPGGTHRNLESLDSHVRWHPEITDTARLLLADAQTSGGLLISLPSERTERLLAELAEGGVGQATIIGEIVEDSSHGIEVLP